MTTNRNNAKILAPCLMMFSCLTSVSMVLVEFGFILCGNRGPVRTGATSHAQAALAGMVFPFSWFSPGIGACRAPGVLGATLKGRVVSIAGHSDRQKEQARKRLS